ncbi:hypothetical protein MMC10_005163 [Thelotrema lepadinum]|nr:hypothetical protein [Thelotrema lepadinum]
MALASTTNPISPTIARTVIGPLTTTFVQPSECTYFGTNPGVFGAGTSYFQAQSCLVPPSNGQAFDASTCWPPPITDTHTTVFAPEPPFNGWGFYSPAYICPSGYSTACTAAQLSDGASSPIVFPGTEFAFQYPLQPGETAVGCCPSGLTCGISDTSQQTCIGTISSTTFEAGFCTGSAYNAVLVAVPGTFVYSVTATQSVSSVDLFAPLIQLNWRAEDLALSSTELLSTALSSTAPLSTELSSIASGVSTMAPTTFSTSVPLAPTSTPNVPSEARLSHEDIIVIGVAVPLSVILLACLTAGIWYRKRQQRSQQRGQGAKKMETERQELDGMKVERRPNRLRELEARGFPQELGTQAWPMRANELDASNSLQELGI